MANVNYDELTYLGLIRQSIADFDAIFGALKDKKVLLDGSLLVDADKSNGKLPTANYADLIGQLYKVDGAVTLNNGTIAYVNEVKAGTDGALKYENGNAVVTVKMPSAAYYTTAAGLTASFAGTDVVYEGTLTPGTLKEGFYVYNPADGVIVKEIKVKQGSAAIKFSEGLTELSHKISADATAAIGSKSLPGVELKAGDQTTGSEKETILIDLSTTYAGSVAVDASGLIDFSAGYITAATQGGAAVTKTIASTASNSTQYTLDIQKASITGIAVSGSVAVDTTASDVAFGSGTSDGYLVAVTGSTAVNTTNATLVPGYLANKESISFETNGANSITATNAYIKKGNIGSATANAASVTVGMTGPTLENGKYVVSASVDEKYEKAITAGYVKDTKFEANLTGTNKVELGVGGAVASLGETSYTPAGATDIFTVGETVTADNVVTISGKAKLTNVITQGYIPESTTPEQELDVVSYQVGIKNGKATAGVTWAAEIIDNEPVGNAGNEGSAPLFTTTEPANTKDYYKITLTPTLSLEAGYVADAAAYKRLNPTTRYMQKAVLEIIENETVGVAVNVKEGGFLPSGVLDANVLKDFDLTAAEVQATLTSDILATSAGSLGAYEISISKGAITAGYISNSNGSLELDSKYYVNKGRVAKGAVTNTGINLSATPTKADNKYTFSGQETVTIALDTTAGYVTAADVAASVSEAVQSSLVLNKAVYNAPNGVISISGSAKAATATDGKYYITPKIDTANLELVIGTAGYIDENITLSLAQAMAADSKIEVQAGSVEAPTGTKAVALSGAESGNTYVVKVADNQTVALTAKVNEGYVSAGTVNGTATLTNAADHVINAATASVGYSAGRVGLTSSTVELHETAAEGKEYVTVVADASVSVNASVTAAGYLKSDGQISVTNPTFSNTTRHIEVLDNADSKVAATETAAGVNVYTVGGQVGDENVTAREITAEKTYNTRNIEIKLHNDAMGASVYAEIEALRLRLQGK